MPYLYVFGRKDATVSVMGANIYPDDIADAIYTDASLAGRILLLAPLAARGAARRDPAAGRHPARARRARRRLPSTAWPADDRSTCGAPIRDYREAFGEYPALMVPVVRLYAAGSGPFEGSGERIKHRYLG